MKSLQLGLSPCPNDTYIFFGLIHNKIDLKGFKITPVFKDVEQLNAMAFQGIPEICKMSFHTFAKLSESYQLLNSGSAFGIGQGPLLISKRKIYYDEIPSVKIAVPGLNTSAMMLLQLEFGNISSIEEYLFSDIEEVVLSGQCDAGLIIHESRFTYQSKGLQKVIDFGELWFKQYNLPIPLGGIAVKRDMDESIKLAINGMVFQSILFANSNLNQVIPFVKQYASEMDEAVMKQHISTYVNKYTLQLEEQGKMALRHFFNEGNKRGLLGSLREPIFVSL
jgi:1,4-dihydroxy-6-naphthoate synthase